MSRIPLSFGYFDENRTNWYATNFVGLMDDFRVYNIALSQSEIDQLYGNGTGDVALVPQISIDPVIEGADWSRIHKFYPRRKALPLPLQSLQPISRLPTVLCWKTPSTRRII